MKKRVITSILGIVFIIICFQTVVFASVYNYATSSHPNPLYYNGYMQIKPSYNDGGYHAWYGYLRYQIKDGSTVIKDSGSIHLMEQVLVIVGFYPKVTHSGIA